MLLKIFSSGGPMLLNNSGRKGPYLLKTDTLKLPVAYESLYPDPDTAPPQPQVPPSDAEFGAPLLPQTHPPLPGSIVPCSRRRFNRSHRRKSLQVGIAMARSP